MGILATTGIVNRSGGSTGAGTLAGQDTTGYNNVVSASMVGSNAPTISVGGKGRVPSQDATRGEESFSEKVGKVIDESRDGQVESGSQDGQQAGVEGNPKKRMWDAEKEAAEEPQRKEEL